MQWQVIKALVVCVFFVLTVFWEACTFELRWRQHENARFSMGVVTVFFYALAAIFWGVFDGVPLPWALYLELVCLFGLFGLGGVVKWSFNVGREALVNADGLEGGHHGRGSIR